MDNGRLGWINFRLYQSISNVLVIIGLISLSLNTISVTDAGSAFDFELILFAIWLIFFLEIFFRQFAQENEVPQYLRSTAGLIDILAVVIPAVGMVIGLDHADTALLCTVWVFKLLRETATLALLKRVISNERKILTGVSTLFLIVLFLASFLAYVLNREGQSDTFGSIPAAMWWAITTLSTTGYGDAVPSSFAGRVLAGVVMTSGIAVFALWAGILASGFARELRRYEFLRNWDLVARVPLLAQLEARELAEIVRLLRSSEVTSGSIICRQGDPGDQMYFIVEGTVLVSTSEPVWLGSGDYFGELSLITGEPRTATVSASSETSLLILDVSDFRVLLANSPKIANAIESVAKQRLELLRKQSQSQY